MRPWCLEVLGVLKTVSSAVHSVVMVILGRRYTVAVHWGVGAAERCLVRHVVPGGGRVGCFCVRV